MTTQLQLINIIIIIIIIINKIGAWPNREDQEELKRSTLATNGVSLLWCLWER